MDSFVNVLIFGVTTLRLSGSIDSLWPVAVIVKVGARHVSSFCTSLSFHNFLG